MSETVLNGRYRLDDQIGEGGMAVVYRGLDLLLNRPVAVKILRAQYAADRGFLKRFEREAQAAASFTHPNIVNVYDVGADQHQHYIVMEYIRGPSLKELIRRQGPFSVDGATFIICQVASALEYAHQRDLVHRDIKPQNILVDREGNAKVVDFGIAKGVRDTDLTEAGAGMGTVHYVSPEQARGEPATPASDLYSTGVVLYEMLTKRLPFEADTPVGVAMLHVNQPVPPPTQYNPQIPPEIEAIILRTLSKNPRDRYPSAAAFANAVRHWDAPEDVRSETGPMTVAERPPSTEPDVIRPQPPPTRERRPPTGRVSAGGTAVRDRPRPDPRADVARDDVGCTTWLVGSAILLAIIGFVVLAFRVVPAILDDSADAGQDRALTLPTPTLVVATPSPTVSVATVASTSTIQTTVLPTATARLVGGLELIPDLIDATLEQAQIAIAGRWNLVIVEDSSDEISAGLIMSQSPEAGVGLDEGESITVVVSTGSGLTEVPDVSGLDANDAIAELDGAGFVSELSEEPSVEVSTGIVIRTEPESFAAPGSVVLVVVSMGDVVLVPDVTGLDADSATTELNAAGLLVGETVYEGCATLVETDPSFDCESYPDGGVVFTSATPLVHVPRGSVIDLTLYSSEL